MFQSPYSDSPLMTSWAYLNKNTRTGPQAVPETVLTKHTVKPDTKRLHQELHLRTDRMGPCSVGKKFY